MRPIIDFKKTAIDFEFSLVGSIWSFVDLFYCGITKVQVLLTIESRRSKRRAPTPPGLSETGLGGWGGHPNSFFADQLTPSQPRGRLCPPNPYLPHRISRPSYGPAHISAVNEPTFLVVLGGGRDGIWFVCSNFQGNEFWKIGLKLRKFRQRRMILWEMTAVNHLSRNHPLVQLFSLAVEVWTYFPSKNIYRMNRGTCFYTRSF